MKRVTLKSEARLNGLDSDIAESTLATIAARLGEISLAAKGGTLDIHLVIRGDLFSEYPGAIVGAHTGIDEALAAASDEPVKTDLNISSVREPKSDGESRKPAKAAP